MTTGNDHQGSDADTPTRKASRVQAAHLVSVSTQDRLEGTTISIGRTLDVSSDGIRLEVLGSVCIEEVLQVSIAVEERMIQVEGRVVHAARTAGGLVEAGIEFTSIDDLDRDLLASQT